MIYERIIKGKFISRPNRFIASIELGGKTEVCHVKNTGRCKELLRHGADVYVQMCDSAERKTKYDLISVYKGDMLVNIDSQAPNKVFGEWVSKSGYFKNVTYIKPEYKYKNSRFDFYIEADGRKILVEVKGVTLENDGVVSFPDAPTERGVKHLEELVQAIGDGYDAYIFFVIQMNHCTYFTPNRENHPQFADALVAAKKSGVTVKALNCRVNHDSLEADSFVDVRL